MTIDQYLTIEDRFKPRTMRKWISRAKNLFQDVPVRIYKKVKETDLFYCVVCGAMPDVVFGTDNPADETVCLVCFKNMNSANEFLT